MGAIAIKVVVAVILFSALFSSMVEAEITVTDSGSDSDSVTLPREQVMESIRGLLSLLGEFISRLFLFLPRCLCTYPLDMLRLII